MKLFISFLFLILAAGISGAMSVEEIGRLSDLKTNDELILQLIEKDGIDKPLATADVIYLREHGTSERVIQYLLKLSESPKAEEQPAVQEASARISENLRTYTTTTKSGKKVRVVTNLDENGQRMGAPVPPPPPEETAEPQPAPQIVRVTVSDERAQEPEPYDGSGYYEEPLPTGGIPLYGGGYPYYPWYTYPYPIIPGGGMNGGHRPPHGDPGWRFHNPQRPLVQPHALPRPSPQQPAPKAASLGVRSSR